MESLQQCYYHDPKTGQFRSSGQAGKGVTNADFILYVAALSSVKCQHAKTIAYAAHCQQEIVLDRYRVYITPASYWNIFKLVVYKIKVYFMDI